MKKRCNGKLTMAGHDIGCPLKKTCIHVDSKDGEVLNEPYSIKNRSCEHYADKRGVCKKIQIKGSQIYECILAPNKVIISCIPHSDFLYLQHINDVYQKFKDRVIFIDLKEKAPYDPVLMEDILNKMNSNGRLDKLINKFNLII